MKCKRPSCNAPARKGDTGFCRAHYNAWLRRRAAENGWQLGYVDATRVNEHLTKLREAGLGFKRIAELAGVDRRSLQGMSKRKRCYAATEAKILRVPLPSRPFEMPAKGARIDPTGTVRRLQALIALGYTCGDLAEHLDSRTDVISFISLGKHAQTTTEFAQRVDEVFRKLELIPPPQTTAAKRSRLRAERNGWPPPFAWDNIDDPNEQPNLGGKTKGHCPWWDDYAYLKSFGKTDEEIAPRLGLDLQNMKATIRRRQEKEKAA